MKGIRCVVVLIALALVRGVRAVPQQAVPPPPKPVDSVPTLEATSNFIREKLSGVGKITYASYYHDDADGRDWINQLTREISNVRFDPGGCGLHYQYVVTLDGQTVTSQGFGIPFQEAEDVVMLPVEQVNKALDSKQGHPTWNTRSDPSVFVVEVRRKGKLNSLFFTDQGLADRVAKAMTHAIELCGGGSKDPF